MSRLTESILILTEEGFPWDVPRSEDKFHCASILSFFPSLEDVTEIWVEWKQMCCQHDIPCKP